MENALTLIEEHPTDGQTGLQNACAQGSGSATVVYPEMDVSSLGQTLAAVGFHSKFMKHVFTSDELDMYDKLKAEARRQKKMLKQRQQIDPSFTTKVIDPLQELEIYKASKCGLDEVKPFGIDKNEAIKVMSFYGDKELERSKMNRAQLKRLFEN